MYHIFIINIFMFRIMVNSKLFLLLRLLFVCYFRVMFFASR